VLESVTDDRRCERVVLVPNDLECLAGHFPGFPVVPGVAQIGWVVEAARELLGRPVEVEAIEALKFKRLLRPGDVVQLRVDLSRDGNALDFRLSDDAAMVSSGRLRLAPAAAPRALKSCVLIPIYEHGETIGGVLDGLASLGVACVVVNDGSGVETTDTLRRLATRHPWVHVEHLPVNRGRGAALRHGYRAAYARGFSHAVQLDADGQHDPADVGRLLEAAERRPEALILGDPRFDETAPPSRLYGRRLSQLIVWAYTGSFAVHDPLCGFRCFPLAPTLAVLERHRFGDRMDFDPEIVVRLVWAGVPVVNVPVRVRYFAGGRSHFRLVRDNALIAATYTRLFFARLGGGWRWRERAGGGA
jgi:GT2 family glycosyltransferase